MSHGITVNNGAIVGQPNARITTGNTKTQSGGKAYTNNNNKYDALNPKYIQFKSRDSQHKKTNSYSMGGFSGALTSYSKGSSKAKNLNVGTSVTGGGPIDTYQIHSTTH
jgi:hypothetical protein